MIDLLRVDGVTISVIGDTGKIQELLDKGAQVEFSPELLARMIRQSAPIEALRHFLRNLDGGVSPISPPVATWVASDDYQAALKELGALGGRAAQFMIQSQIETIRRKAQLHDAYLAHFQEADRLVEISQHAYAEAIQAVYQSGAPNSRLDEADDLRRRADCRYAGCRAALDVTTIGLSDFISAAYSALEKLLALRYGNASPPTVFRFGEKMKLFSRKQRRLLELLWDESAGVSRGYVPKSEIIPKIYPIKVEPRNDDDPRPRRFYELCRR